MRTPGTSTRRVSFEPSLAERFAAKLAPEDLAKTTPMGKTVDSTGDWRVLFQKGRNDGERTPALFLEPLTRGVEFFVSTDDASQPAGERIWSNSFIPLHRWTHVAAVAEGHTLRMYINGLLDCENQTVGTITHNVGPMYVGGHPWRPIGGVDSYIDEVQYHGRALSTDEIQAKASFALGGASSVRPLPCISAEMTWMHCDPVARPSRQRSTSVTHASGSSASSKRELSSSTAFSCTRTGSLNGS